MSILDSIPGVGDIVKIGTKALDVLNKILDNTGIRNKFRETGRVNGVVSIYDYKVTFLVEDLKRKNATAIEGEVVEDGRTSE